VPVRLGPPRVQTLLKPIRRGGPPTYDSMHWPRKNARISLAILSGTSSGDRWPVSGMTVIRAVGIFGTRARSSESIFSTWSFSPSRVYRTHPNPGGHTQHNENQFSD
jgi:hypothetical protein